MWRTNLTQRWTRPAALTVAWVLWMAQMVPLAEAAQWMRAPVTARGANGLRSHYLGGLRVEQSAANLQAFLRQPQTFNTPRPFDLSADFPKGLPDGLVDALEQTLHTRIADGSFPLTTEDLTTTPSVSADGTSVRFHLAFRGPERTAALYQALAKLVAEVVDELKPTAPAPAAPSPIPAPAPAPASVAPPTLVGINGAGRIGVNVIRAWLEHPRAIQIVAINDVAFKFAKNDLKGLKNFARLLRLEFRKSSLQNVQVTYGKKADGPYWIAVDGQEIIVTDNPEPSKLPWGTLKVDVVLEATGRFTSKDAASQHLQAGAKRVIITAPATGELQTIAPGVNQDIIDPTQLVQSCASCTTNALASALRTIHDALGVEEFYMSTTHAYTADQALQPVLRPEAPQRGMAAAENIIPSSTGAAKAIGEVIPGLKGKGDGIALRVPVADGSIVGFTMVVSRPTTKQEVNDLLKAAAAGPLKGIMAFSEEELVSQEILGRPESSIVDGTLTHVSKSGRLVTVWSWYDNEFGYSNRVLDLVKLLTQAPAPAPAETAATETGVPAPVPAEVAAALEEQRPAVARAIEAEVAARAPEAAAPPTPAPGVIPTVIPAVTPAPAPAPAETAAELEAQLDRAEAQPRRPIVGGNWKMAIKGPWAAFKLLRGVARQSKEVPSEAEVVLLPSFTELPIMTRALRHMERRGEIEKGRIVLGAQDLAAEEPGARTGAISYAQVKGAGGSYVVIGHSERRHGAIRGVKESSEDVNAKVKAALKAGLKVIMAIGETLDERDKGRTMAVLEEQVRVGLKDVTAEQMANVVIAYEPVWAIGTGRTATKEQAQEAHRFIRGILLTLYGGKVAAETRIQYGGSMNPTNAADLMAQPSVDGGLIGGAALKPADFIAIIRAAAASVKPSPAPAPGPARAGEPATPALVTAEAPSGFLPGAPPAPAAEPWRWSASNKEVDPTEWKPVEGETNPAQPALLRHEKSGAVAYRNDDGTYTVRQKGSIGLGWLAWYADPALRDRPVTAKEFARARGYSERTAGRELNGLVRAGLADIDTSGRAAVYTLKEGARRVSTLAARDIALIPAFDAYELTDQQAAAVRPIVEVQLEIAHPTGSVEIDPQVAADFPDLFGTKKVNDRPLNVERVIRALTRQLEPDIKRALDARRRALESKEPVRVKYAFPKPEEPFTDVDGTVRTFAQIIQGQNDNLLGRNTELAWRMNDEVPIPEDAFPLTNPGLELTGPWAPLDMAIKQINADVAATMGPDDEDAAPSHYVPAGAPADQPVGLFVSRHNERRLLAGEVDSYTATKKGQPVTYRIQKPLDQRPTSFHRVPSLHLPAHHVKVDGKPAPGMVVDYVIHALSDFGSLQKIGRGLYYYQPKIQTPQEALVVAKLVWTLEQLMGATKPGQFIKMKLLYEEGRAGLYLPVIMWILRHWLIGTNVGRWDYTGSLIEMWKDERVLPDPQNGKLMGMTAPHMVAYQRYNALCNVRAGMKRQENGELALTNAAAVGGMAAVMLSGPTDPYGRHRHNPVALRAMENDKRRERLIGLMFVPEAPLAKGQKVTLDDILAGRVKGTFIDAYRQSWVATPDPAYVAAGNLPLRAKVEDLQAMLDKPEEPEVVDGQRVAPKVGSGLTEGERNQLKSLGLLNDAGQITPWVLPREAFESPEAFFSSTELWGGRNLWDSLYDIPEGEITIENVQHAVYMDGNYGFQILGGNLAAAIDDYAILSPKPSRFMNDLATYRIFVGSPWTVLHLGARITKGGWLKGPKLTEDGLIPGENRRYLEAGTVVTPEIFQQLWQLHNEWTEAFFKEQDRLAAIRLVAATIVDWHGGKKHLKRDAELIPFVVQALVTSLLQQRSPQEIAGRVAEVLGRYGLVVESSAVEADLALLEQVEPITSILSLAYGTGPAYAKTLSYQEAADQAAKLLGVEPSACLAEIEAAAPRFDRSKALVIMDVLKRQLLSSRYLQHSPRVLFEIADKTPEERIHILNAIYYVDESGTPLFRDDAGQPSRDKIVEAVVSGNLPAYALAIHDHVYDIFPAEEVQPEPKVELTVVPASEETHRQAAELEERWKEEWEQYGVERRYDWELLRQFYPSQKVPEDQRPSSMAEAVVRLRGALDLDTYNTARANANEFRRQVYEVPETDPDHYVYSIGTYAGHQAVNVIQAWQALKRAGVDVPRLGSYMSGWVLAATRNTTGEGALPDQQLYPTIEAQRQSAMDINGALRSAARTASIKADPGTTEDWLPLTVMDFEAPPSALHAFLMAMEAIRAGVGVFHVERQSASHKVCGHGGGGCERTTTEHEQVIMAIRLAADVLNVPVVIIGRGDATHIPFLNNDDPLDRPFIEGVARDRDGKVVRLRSESAARGHHAEESEEVKDRSAFAEAQARGFAGNWTDRGVEEGPSGTWTPARTQDRLYRIRNGVERAIYNLSLMAPYVDLVWEDTHDVTLEQAKVIADGVHILGRLYRGAIAEREALDQLVRLGLSEVFAKVMVQQNAARARTGSPNKMAPDKPLGFNTSPNLGFKDKSDEELRRWSRDLARMGYRWHVQTLAAFRAVGARMFDYAQELAETGVYGLGKLQRFEAELAKRGYQGNLSQVSAAGLIFDSVGLLAGRGPEQQFVAGSTEAAQVGLPPAGGVYASLEARERLLLDTSVEQVLGRLDEQDREGKREAVTEALAATFLAQRRNRDAEVDPAPTVAALEAAGVPSDGLEYIVEHVLGKARYEREVSTRYALLPAEVRDQLRPVIAGALEALHPAEPADSRARRFLQDRAVLQGVTARIYGLPYNIAGDFTTSLQRLGLSAEQAYGILNEVSALATANDPVRRRVVFGYVNGAEAWNTLFPGLPKIGFTLRFQRRGAGEMEGVTDDTTLKTDDLVSRVPVIGETAAHRPKPFITTLTPGYVIADARLEKLDGIIQRVTDVAITSGKAEQIGPGLPGTMPAILAKAATRAGLSEKLASERRIVLLTNNEDPSLWVEGEADFVASSGAYDYPGRLPQVTGSHYFKSALVDVAPLALGDEGAEEYLATLLKHEDDTLNWGDRVTPVGRDAEILHQGARKIRQYLVLKALPDEAQVNMSLSGTWGDAEVETLTREQGVVKLAAAVKVPGTEDFNVYVLVSKAKALELCSRGIAEQWWPSSTPEAAKPDELVTWEAPKGFLAPAVVSPAPVGLSPEGPEEPSGTARWLVGAVARLTDRDASTISVENSLEANGLGATELNVLYADVAGYARGDFAALGLELDLSMSLTEAADAIDKAVAARETRSADDVSIEDLGGESGPGGSVPSFWGWLIEHRGPHTLAEIGIGIAEEEGRVDQDGLLRPYSPRTLEEDERELRLFLSPRERPLIRLGRNAAGERTYEANPDWTPEEQSTVRRILESPYPRAEVKHRDNDRFRARAAIAALQADRLIRDEAVVGRIVERILRDRVDAGARATMRPLSSETIRLVRETLLQARRDFGRTGSRQHAIRKLVRLLGFDPVTEAQLVQGYVIDAQDLRAMDGSATGTPPGAAGPPPVGPVGGAPEPVRNPFLTKMQERMRRAAEAEGLSADLTERLLATQNLHTEEATVTIDGQDWTFFFVRAQDNNWRGPFKGGIRYLYRDSDSLGPLKDRLEELARHEHSPPALQQLVADLQRWVTEEAQALAKGMTMKNALAGLPLGGGKATVLLVGYQRDASGQVTAVKPFRSSELPENDLKLITASIGMLWAAKGIVGHDRDVPAPDVNTGGREMAWLLEAHLRALAVAGDIAIEAPSAEQLAADEFFYTHAAIRLRLPHVGTYTGKRADLGGLAVRAEATGLGATYAIDRALEIPAVALRLRDAAHSTVAINGAGNAALYAARFNIDGGRRVVAINDTRGALLKESGFTPEDLDRIEAIKRDGKSVTDAAAGIPESQAIVGKEAGAHAVLSHDVDILILAGVEDAIHAGNVNEVRARLIAEEANGPITTEADAALFANGRIVIPDSIASAGGVIVSWHEMTQNDPATPRRNEQDIRTDTNQRVDLAIGSMWDLAQSQGISLRDAGDRLVVRGLAALADAGPAYTSGWQAAGGSAADPVVPAGPSTPAPTHLENQPFGPSGVVPPGVPPTGPPSGPPVSPAAPEPDESARRRATLRTTAASMAPATGGILAADESVGTAAKRLQSVGLDNTPEHRQAMRRTLLTPPGLRQAGIAAVILDRDTLTNTVSDQDPTTLVAHLRAQGIIPGLKTDEGLDDDPAAPKTGVKVVKDPTLSKLPALLARANELGLGFTKYRTTIRVNNPPEDNLRANAQIQAQQAKLAQAAGLVPIVEPEVVYDGSDGSPATHSLQESYATTVRTLEATFEELAAADVYLPGMILKTSMVLAGKKAPAQTAPDLVGFETLRCLLKTVPATVAGIVFLSGGQADDQATANLDAVARASQTRFTEARDAAVAELRNEGKTARAEAIAALTAAPWQLSYSFGRGLQARALKAWSGKPAQIPQGQAAMVATAREVQAARQGRLGLYTTARHMVPPEGGILAADEGAGKPDPDGEIRKLGTAGKRLQSVGLPETPKNRELMRRTLLTTPGLRQAGVAAVILDRDTLTNTISDTDPTTLMAYLKSQGIIPGLKTDEGLEDDPAYPGEKGVKRHKDPQLAKLPALLARAKELGLGFTKFRTTIRVNEPPETNLRANAQIQAQQAKLAQAAGLVPMVEPEVIYDGSDGSPATHSLQESYTTTVRTLEATFEELTNAGVWLPGMILKTSMVLAGKKASAQTDPDLVGFETLKCLLKTVPATVAGIAFLSGGQGDDQATQNLDGVARASQQRFTEARDAVVDELRAEGKTARADDLAALTHTPWPISYSFGRGLQAKALKAWGGKPEHVPAAQTAMRATAQEVQAARQGRLIEALPGTRGQAEDAANAEFTAVTHRPSTPIPSPGKDNVTAIGAGIIRLRGDVSVSKSDKDTSAQRVSDAVTIARGDREHVMAIEGELDITEYGELEAGGVHEVGFVVNPTGTGDDVYVIRDDIEVTNGFHTNRNGAPRDRDTSNPPATSLRAWGKWGEAVQRHGVVPEMYAMLLAANVPVEKLPEYRERPLDPQFDPVNPHDELLAAITRLASDNGRSLDDVEVVIMKRAREKTIKDALLRIKKDHPGLVITEVSDGTVDPARMAMAGRKEGKYLIALCVGKSTEGTHNWFESSVLKTRGAVFGMRYLSKNVNKVFGEDDRAIKEPDPKAPGKERDKEATDQRNRYRWSEQEEGQVRLFQRARADAWLKGELLLTQDNVPGDVEIAVAHLTDNPWFNLPGARRIGDDTVRVWTTRLSSRAAREQGADLWVEIDDVGLRAVQEKVGQAEAKLAAERAAAQQAAAAQAASGHLQRARRFRLLGEGAPSSELERAILQGAWLEQFPLIGEGTMLTPAIVRRAAALHEGFYYLLVDQAALGDNAAGVLALERLQRQLREVLPKARAEEAEGRVSTEIELPSAIRVAVVMRGTHSVGEAQAAGQAWLAERLPQASIGSSRLTAEEVPVFLPEDPAQLEALLQQDANAQAGRLTEQLHEALWPAGSPVPISAVPVGPTNFLRGIRAANLRPAASAQAIVTDPAQEANHSLRSDEAVVAAFGVAAGNGRLDPVVQNRLRNVSEHAGQVVVGTVPLDAETQPMVEVYRTTLGTSRKGG